MAYISFQPKDYFNTKLYTGTGATNAQTSVGFQPDWVWIQNRGGTYANVFFDAVRGATKKLEPSGTGGEATVSDTLTSFDSDGFTLGADSSSYCNRSSSPNTYVAWNWKANGSGSANTDGSISTTVSANTTSGFSIIQYTGNSTSGATIGHGLGAVPKVYLCKKANSSGDSWRMYTEMTGNDSQLALDQTSSADSGNTAMWNSTTPTSSVITLGNHTGVNGNTDTFIGYAFAEKQGFSKFGSYTGNGSTDAPFIYTGFKPSFIMLKNITTAQDWQMYTFDMQPFNEFCTTSAGRLKANTTDAQSTKSAFDMLSNGFKMRTSASDINASGNEIIYMAFAEAPLVGSNNVPCTAR